MRPASVDGMSIPGTVVHQIQSGRGIYQQERSCDSSPLRGVQDGKIMYTAQRYEFSLASKPSILVIGYVHYLVGSVYSVTREVATFFCRP